MMWNSLYAYSRADPWCKDRDRGGEGNARLLSVPSACLVQASVLRAVGNSKRSIQRTFLEARLMAPSATQEMISLITTTSNNVLHITKDLTDLKSSVATNQERLGEVVTQIKLIDSNIKNYNDNQSKLFKIIRDGNGQPSILDRLTKVEASLQHIEADIDDMKSCVEDVRKAVDNFQTAKTVTKGQIVTAVASMVATLVMSLWAVLAQIMKP